MNKIKILKKDPRQIWSFLTKIILAHFAFKTKLSVLTMEIKFPENLKYNNLLLHMKTYYANDSRIKFLI